VKSAYVGSSAVSGEDDPHGTDFVTCSRGVKIIPDLRLPDLAGGKALEEYDAIVVPGGNKGAETISANEDVTKLISAFYGKGKLVACICAGESYVSVPVSSSHG
jgi:putative intracellular protease/amidase